MVGLTYLVVSGLLLQGFVNVMNSAYSLRDTMTAEGIHKPATSLRSGGPGSLIGWDSLGWQGRNFIGKGPSVSDIAKFTGHPATEPIRIYAGLASADGAEAQAALAVRDLQRAGGFQRKNLLVVTTTGSGWVDPALVDSFEYLSGGDCATVAIQYSYLPSWISYLVDQSKALAAGRALFDAVYGAWAKLPADHRPRLFVAGESLGSFGGEAAFTGENDIANRTTGALFAGPPNFNALFRQFSDHRDPGSPEVQPVYQDGRIVRFANDPATAIPPQGQPWDGTRVLYLMHPSDPIVWWSPHLIWSEPDWISETPGKDVLKSIIWLPFLTFWQVTADLPFATGVPEATATGTRPNTSTGGMPSCGPPALPPRTWPASGRSSRTEVITPGAPPRAAGGLAEQAGVVDREPRDGEREAVGRGVRDDRGDQAPGPQPEPAEGQAGDERHRDRAQHQQHLPADAARRAAEYVVVRHRVQRRRDVPEAEQRRRDQARAPGTPQFQSRPQQDAAEGELLRDRREQDERHPQLVQQPSAADLRPRIVQEAVRRRDHRRHHQDQQHEPEHTGAVKQARRAHPSGQARGQSALRGYSTRSGPAPR